MRLSKDIQGKGWENRRIQVFVARKMCNLAEVQLGDIVEWRNYVPVNPLERIKWDNDHDDNENDNYSD